jgi:hypothetical protein
MTAVHLNTLFPRRILVSISFLILSLSHTYTHTFRDRVVAVFVAGPTWQFKDWPESMKGADANPANIFSKSMCALI